MSPVWIALLVAGFVAMLLTSIVVTCFYKSKKKGSQFNMLDSATLASTFDEEGSLKPLGPDNKVLADEVEDVKVDSATLACTFAVEGSLKPLGPDNKVLADEVEDVKGVYPFNLMNGDCFHDGRLVLGGQMTIECRACTNTSIKTGLSDDERMQLSVHEAGHAWLAFRGGLRVVKITLVPNGELLGRTIIEHGEKHIWSLKEKNNLQIAFWGARQAEVALRDNGMTSLFGADKLAIEKLAASNVREFGLLEDQSLATIKPESNEFVALQERAIYNNMRFCELEAKKMVEEDKEAINALASILYEYNELSDEKDIRRKLTKLQDMYKNKQ